MKPMRTGFQHFRRPLALVLAGLIFLGSPLNHVGANAPLRTWSPFRQIHEFNDALRLKQYWKMFSPPGKAAGTLAGTFRFDQGWTELVVLGEVFHRRDPGQIIATRGHSRVHNHLRSHAAVDRGGGGLPLSRQLFFDNLGLFYCRGIGRIPDLRAVRFYVIRRGIPPFHARDTNGHPAPPAEALDEQIPLYELQCDA
jgi:hypothetical protein